MITTNLTLSSCFVFFLTIFFISEPLAQETEYQNLTNWAVHPSLTNRVFEGYIKDSANIEKVDVFYIYPTMFLDKQDLRWNIPIDDSVFQKRVLENAIKFQASAFAEGGRMFAPYYSQAHIRAYRNLENGGRNALLLAYGDVRAAFVHYLANYNNGRPIILRIAFKPVSSIAKDQLAYASDGQVQKLKINGRHDALVLPRALPIVEAMAALVLADALLLQKIHFK